MDSAQILEATLRGDTFSVEEARSILNTVLDGGCDAHWLAGWLVALRARGETVDEIEGFTRAMREHVRRVSVRLPRLIDTCGTGGDGGETFNVSTAAALVVAGAGGRVAKHGNRSVSSRSGSADVLEALGGRLDVSGADSARAIAEIGFGFLFAPAHHGAMRHAAAARRALGIRTVFNLLGPLANPAEAEHQIIGVFDRRWVNPIATVLGRLGAGRSLVVHGRDGLDEISVCAPTDAVLVEGGKLRDFVIDPTELGIPLAEASALAGGDALENARRIRAILAGRKGADADIVRLNAGAALWVAGHAEDLRDGLNLASAALADGTAATVLERWLAFTREQAS